MSFPLHIDQRQMRLRFRRLLAILMALYYNPKMNALVPATLKKRMQDKTWFNFKSVDKELFAELKALTQSAVDDYMKREML